MPNRTPVIAGNWKMYKTAGEARAMVEELKPLVAEVKDREIIVAPTFTALAVVAEAVYGSNIKVAAQNMFWEPEGAYTGEISPLMLKDLGVEYVILGHSERRQYFGETDAGVNKKIKAALAYGLKPILCVGETLGERESGSTQLRISGQFHGAVEGLAPEQMAQIIIAYEPVWAIGTGKTASNDDAQNAIGYIRGLVSYKFGPKVAEIVPIQYGGSVKPDNIAGLMAQPDIDGALVGGASLDAAGFSSIVKYDLVRV